MAALGEALRLHERSIREGYERALGLDVLSSAEALRQVCEVENAVLGMPTYDEFCFDDPSPTCLGGLCAGAARSAG